MGLVFRASLVHRGNAQLYERGGPFGFGNQVECAFTAGSITNTFRNKLTEFAFPKSYGGAVFRLCPLTGVSSSHAADEVLRDAAYDERGNQTRIMLCLSSTGGLASAVRPSPTEGPRRGLAVSRGHNYFSWARQRAHDA
jgi:hypothetical protein